MELGRLSESETSLRKSIRISERVYSINHSKTWMSKGELSICYFKQKKYQQAEELLFGVLNFYKNAI